MFTLGITKQREGQTLVGISNARAWKCMSMYDLNDWIRTWKGLAICWKNTVAGSIWKLCSPVCFGPTRSTGASGFPVRVSHLLWVIGVWHCPTIILWVRDFKMKWFKRPPKLEQDDEFFFNCNSFAPFNFAKASFVPRWILAISHDPCL